MLRRYAVKILYEQELHRAADVEAMAEYYPASSLTTSWSITPARSF